MRIGSRSVVVWILMALPVRECSAFLFSKKNIPTTNSNTCAINYQLVAFPSVSRLRQSNKEDGDEESLPESTDDILNQKPQQPMVGPQSSTAEPIRTIGGGADMIFEMARQMLLWDETEDSLQSSTADGAATSNSRKTTTKSNFGPSSSSLSTSKFAASSSKSVLPRWHPIRGVSDANPSFRTAAPMMNSQGYAGTIWRNVRKANKPSLWRHALRTYDRMGEKPAAKQQQAKDIGSLAMTTRNNDNNDSSNNNRLKVQRTNVHHDGALVACAKLGLWQKALQIYRDVEEQQERPTSYQKVFVTDNMVLSLIRSCVLASRAPGASQKTAEERRLPLDACLEVLLEMEDQHGLPLVARHLNPLAAAYQKIPGFGVPEAARLLTTHLSDRTSGPEEEDGDDPFNVNDVRAKDKGSYSLLVKGAVSEGNWEGAVEALKLMTDSGLYPKARNLNGWTEVSERKTKQRATRSWKKKRDEYWLESVR